MSYQASPFSSSPASRQRNIVKIFDVRQIRNELVVIENVVGVDSVDVAALSLDDRHLVGKEKACLLVFWTLMTAS